VALIDSTKVGQDSLLTIFGAREPEEIITDQAVSSERLAEYRAAGVNLVVAGSKKPLGAEPKPSAVTPITGQRGE
jgi:hypothetical protein